MKPFTDFLDTVNEDELLITAVANTIGLDDPVEASVKASKEITLCLLEQYHKWVVSQMKP